MESKDYERILDAMPETGVYVIREEDHGILYFNKRVHTIPPEVRLGMPCHEVWTGSCINCPLLTIKDRQEGRSIGYNPTFGGVVDMVATRTLWQDTIPAFVVTVTPRLETAGYVYRKILRVDLEEDRYDVLKLEPDAWLTGDNTVSLSSQLESLAVSGVVHPDDRERFLDFINLTHLKEALQSGKNKLTCIYRRQWKGDFRWNLMEVVKCFDYCAGNQTVIFCIMDVHDSMREGLEYEETSSHNYEILRTIGEHSFRIYDIDLKDGTVESVYADGHTPNEPSAPTQLWDTLLNAQIKDQLHSAYQKTFEERFSLNGLRQAQESGKETPELLCQWSRGGTYRYISVTAYPGSDQKSKDHIILAFQDMDEKIRRELVHSQRDMQMASILRSRYNMMNTVHLESGQCERICLEDTAELSNTLIGDYDYHTSQAMCNHVHPEDAARYYSILSLEHLRKIAESVDNYAEEVCQYRLKCSPVRWIEQHVIYNRKEGNVIVNVLGQDITGKKLEEQKQLQALQDRSYIISSLSSLFFSTYYVDLNQDTFRAVSQLGKMGDVLGSEVNCTAALRVYADNFVHPDDRDDFCQIMNISNWLESLRWWQPYVTFTYRQMPEDLNIPPENYRWIRATAVLAQTGEDDLPKTVVYVAQDITESKTKKGLD